MADSIKEGTRVGFCSASPQKFKCFQINKNIAADRRLRVTWTENISHLQTVQTKCLCSDPVTQKKFFSCKIFLGNIGVVTSLINVASLI